MLERHQARLASSSRTLESGLIQIVNAILQKFSDQGVLNRADAFEFLANSRDPWNAQGPVVDGDESEPLPQLVEKLDATVFGLIEALDADSADLPRLLDEALQGSLWARQLRHRERGAELQEWHRWILQARAQLIWRTTTAPARRGHFAMGVGFEAGLALDAMADQLNVLIDQADRAALPGDQEQLVTALVGLAERLLVLRPFVPEAKNALPVNWRDLLRQWVTGVDVNMIGTDNMGVVEDAFTYRLVWAMEALRTRRASLGWEADIISGGGAATLETGVPQYMMAMLIRAGFEFIPTTANTSMRCRTSFAQVHKLFIASLRPRVIRPYRGSITRKTTSGLPAPIDDLGLPQPLQTRSPVWKLARSPAPNQGGRFWRVQRHLGGASNKTP
jgi:hypothetical protein